MVRYHHHVLKINPTRFSTASGQARPIIRIFYPRHSQVLTPWISVTGNNNCGWRVIEKPRPPSLTSILRNVAQNVETEGSRTGQSRPLWQKDARDQITSICSIHCDPVDGRLQMHSDTTAATRPYLCVRGRPRRGNGRQSWVSSSRNFVGTVWLGIPILHLRVLFIFVC